jgi:hypothetical protein
VKNIFWGLSNSFVLTRLLNARRKNTKFAEIAMKFLCLIYENELRWQTMPKPEFDRIFADYRAFTDGIKQSGHYLGGNPLQPTRTAKTIRIQNGKTSITDGPFAETKEQLGGYYLIEAKDQAEAVEIGAKIPGAHLGSIEVRPIMEMM